MTRFSPDTAALPSAETMLTYASILEKPQYWIDPRGQKWLLATGEIIEAACAALRVCAAGAAQAPPIVSMISDDELAELVDVHLALDRLSAPRQSEGFDLSAARRVNLLVHEMEQEAQASPERIAELQYEAGMYRSLYENAIAVCAPISEGERHAVAHAKYQCDHASEDNTEVSFDFELVQTLLKLIDRLRTVPRSPQENAGRLP